MLLREEAAFDAALRLRNGMATVAEIYSFISGLYFRGKIAYAEAFAAPPPGVPPALVIVPGFGLVPPLAAMNAEQLAFIGGIDVDEGNRAYREPLVRDAALVDQSSTPVCQYVLLGSIATQKYTEPLLSIFGERLLFPAEFVGRGDMSRGGLMLRCARSGDELTYVRVEGAIRKGSRPGKLPPWPRP